MKAGRLTKKESIKIKEEILDFCKGVYRYEKSIKKKFDLTERQIKYQLKYLQDNGQILRDPNLHDLRSYIYITNPQTAEGIG